MNPRSLCAIVLALALPALGQTEPQLEPLVPPSVQKNKKKPKRKPPDKKAPAEQAQALDAAPQGQEPSALPPLRRVGSTRSACWSWERFRTRPRCASAMGSAPR